MSWNRSSEALALAATLLVLVAAVGTVAAVSTSSEGVPSDGAKVGSEATATYTFTELYSDYESWTLHGETELTNVTWTVRQLDQAGNQVSQQSYDGQSFNASVALNSDTAKVIVNVRGTVPAVENFSYDPPQRFAFATFELVREGGTREPIASDAVRPYTEQSQNARTQIEQAKRAINQSGGNEQAEKTLKNAISAYNGRQFDLAVELANQAEQEANQAQQTQSRNQMLLYGGIGVVALLLAGSGVYYWRSQQDDYDKLR